MFRTSLYRELARKLPDVVGAETAKELAKMGLLTVDDLLRHVPRRYVASGQLTSFADLPLGEDIAVIARVKRSAIRTGSRMRVEAIIEDSRGAELTVTLFVPTGRGARAEALGRWWLGQLAPSALGIFVGKLTLFRNALQLTHPDYVILEGAKITARKRDTVRAKSQEAMVRLAQRSTMIGIYPATAKLPTWLVAEAIQLVLPTVRGDTLPYWIITKANEPSFEEALRDIHEPIDREQAARGLERLRFDEAFGIQLAMAHRRAKLSQERAIPRVKRAGGILAALDDSVPFELTQGQKEVGEKLFEELAQEHPMHRLVQGEVGSGKTLVALRAMCAVVDDGGQAVLIAPTEVLAKQHYLSIKKLLGPLGNGRDLANPTATRVTLLTGSMTASEKRESLNAIITGEAGIVVGTHALFSDSVEFFDLGLVVIDEQHRFGVEQRAALVAKATHRPHMLVMTATPIPRTIAMTIFGDLSVSELRDRPQGRAPVQTVLVNTLRNPEWVTRAWQRIREEVQRGRQAFIVCPAIKTDESADRQLVSVEELTAELQSGPLSDLRVDYVHGKQLALEREAKMAAFAAGDFDVLVATTVIEVGVDIPNASMMVIMDADRFGLAQLHQLRGRIGRGNHPGLCLLLAPLKPGDEKAQTRLEAIANTQDGFALAELDLEIRREGDVLGSGQSGRSSLKLLRIADEELIRRAKELAEEVASDDRASQDPLLADLLAKAEEIAAGEWMEKG